MSKKVTNKTTAEYLAAKLKISVEEAESKMAEVTTDLVICKEPLLYENPKKVQDRLVNKGKFISDISALPPFIRGSMEPKYKNHRVSSLSRNEMLADIVEDFIKRSAKDEESIGQAEEKTPEIVSNIETQNNDNNNKFKEEEENKAMTTENNNLKEMIEGIKGQNNALDNQEQQGTGFGGSLPENVGGNKIAASTAKAKIQEQQQERIAYSKNNKVKKVIGNKPSMSSVIVAASKLTRDAKGKLINAASVTGVVVATQETLTDFDFKVGYKEEADEFTRLVKAAGNAENARLVRQYIKNAITGNPDTIPVNVSLAPPAIKGVEIFIKDGGTAELVKIDELPYLLLDKTAAVLTCEEQPTVQFQLRKVENKNKNKTELTVEKKDPKKPLKGFASVGISERKRLVEMKSLVLLKDFTANKETEKSTKLSSDISVKYYKTDMMPQEPLNLDGKAKRCQSTFRLSVEADVFKLEANKALSKDIQDKFEAAAGNRGLEAINLENDADLNKNIAMIEGIFIGAEDLSEFSKVAKDLSAESAAEAALTAAASDEALESDVNEI